MMPSGVRISWARPAAISPTDASLAAATRSCWARRRSVAIVLNAAVSAPISSRLRTGRGGSVPPRARPRAASVRECSGCVMRRAMMVAAMVPAVNTRASATNRRRRMRSIGASASVRAWSARIVHPGVAPASRTRPSKAAACGSYTPVAGRPSGRGSRLCQPSARRSCPSSGGACDTAASPITMACSSTTSRSIATPVAARSRPTSSATATSFGQW